MMGWIPRNLALITAGTVVIALALIVLVVVVLPGGGESKEPDQVADQEPTQEEPEPEPEPEGPEIVIGGEVNNYHSQAMSELYEEALLEEGYDVEYELYTRLEGMTSENGGFVEYDLVPYFTIEPEIVSGDYVEESTVYPEPAMDAVIEYIVVMREEKAQEHGVTDVSQLVDIPDVTVGMPKRVRPLERFEPELEEANPSVRYDFDVSAPKDDIASGRVDAAVISSNDSAIAAIDDLVVLDDEEELLDEYPMYITAAIDQEYLDEHPTVLEAVAEVNEIITDEALSELVLVFEEQGQDEGIEAAEDYYHENIK